MRALLARNHELSPEFAGGFSNHLSMGLYSLAALGGSRAELTRFAEAHWARLEPLPSGRGPKVGRDNWWALLGRRDALNGFRELFGAEIARLGRDGALRAYLPGLLPGIAAGAFHALIRTGYGVRFRDDHEVQDGLAYWATTFLPLGPLGPAGRERDPRALLGKVQQNPRLAGLDLPGQLIFGKMKAAAELPAFAAAVDALQPTDTTVAGLAAASVRLYLLNGNFTALHAVTGTHAFRQLSPFLPTRDGVRYLWQALVAAYISVGAPRLVEPGARAVPDFARSIPRAIASLDDHDLKLVEVAREEEAFYRDPIYRRAAALRMQL
ncbi:MAG: questin oxidase family protein [Deltaproteobacteria bacterium]